MAPYRGPRYLPVPRVRSGSTFVTPASGDGWVQPEIAPDGRHLSPDTTTCNLFGGSTAGVPVPSGETVQLAVAVEMASPDDFAGAALAERFEAFKDSARGRDPPDVLSRDPYHPVGRYRDLESTLTVQFAGNPRWGFGPRALLGAGDDWIGDVIEDRGTAVDYARLSFLDSRPAAALEDSDRVALGQPASKRRLDDRVPAGRADLLRLSELDADDAPLSVSRVRSRGSLPHCDIFPRGSREGLDAVHAHRASRLAARRVQRRGP